MFVGAQRSFSKGDKLSTATSQRCRIPALLFPAGAEGTSIDWQCSQSCSKFLPAQAAAQHSSLENTSVTFLRGRGTLGDMKLCELVDGTKGLLLSLAWASLCSILRAARAADSPSLEKLGTCNFHWKQ